DYIGAALFAAAISLLLLMTVVESNQWVYGVVGAVLLVIFYLYEKKQASPLVPLTLVQHKTLKWMNMNGFISCVALFGT
ncbi:major facilitator superfamily transporter, partial [Anoxybacillus sp. LAT_11]|nr:major facilitator superfamily transporter [Anoxybacillus sp. LAT_11]